MCVPPTKPVKFKVKRFSCTNCKEGHPSSKSEHYKFLKKIEDPVHCRRCLGYHDIRDCTRARNDCGCGGNHDTHAIACKIATAVVAECTGLGEEQGDGKSSALLHFMRVKSSGLSQQNGGN